jgi:hypothetical protein
MTCECFQIGGRFIAEDPDCPAHGRDAQRRDSERDALRVDISLATSVEELRELMLRVLDTFDC